MLHRFAARDCRAAGPLGTPSDGWLWHWHLGAYVAAVLVLTIGVAALIYYAVERPSIRLGRRLAKRWFDEPEPSATPAVVTPA